jgi:hypothetical protein
MYISDCTDSYVAYRIHSKVPALGPVYLTYLLTRFHSAPQLYLTLGPTQHAAGSSHWMCASGGFPVGVGRNYIYIAAAPAHRLAALCLLLPLAATTCCHRVVVEGG